MATKKKHLKTIRREAAGVPQVDVKTSQKEQVLGAELIYQGTTEIEGVAVVPGLWYTVHMPVLLAANHERRMKKIFKARGNAGLLDYFDAVDRANGKTPPPRDVVHALQPGLMAKVDPGKTVFLNESAPINEAAFNSL